MGIVLLIILLLLLFGGPYYGYRSWGPTGGFSIFGVVLAVIVLLALTGNLRLG